MYLARSMKYSLLLFYLSLPLLGFTQASDDRIPFRDGDKWGYAVTKDSLAIDPQYTYAARFDNGLAAVQKRRKWGFIDSSGTVIVPIDYKEVRPFHNGRSIVIKDSLFGMVDDKGNTVVPCQFERLKYLNGDQYAVRGKTGWGLVSKDGDLLTPWFFEYLGKSHKGYIPASANGKWGFLDSLGKEASPFIYDMISRHENEWKDFTVRLAGGTHNLSSDQIPLLWKYHVMGDSTDTGRFRYLRIYDDSKGYLGSGWGWARLGDQPHRARYLESREFSENRAAVLVDGKWGYLDTTLEMKIANRWEEAYSFSNGLGLVHSKNGYGFLDHKGKKVVKPQYGQARPFANGFAAASTSREGWGNWGYLDSLGNPITEFEFISASDFEGGCAVVGMYDEKTGEKRYGAIDEQGDKIIPVEFDGVWMFMRSVFIVAKGEMLGVYDLDGKRSIPHKYHSLLFFGDKYGPDHIFAHNKKDKIGVIGPDGKKITKFEYDDCQWNSVLLALWVTKNGKMGIINKGGEVLLPVKYDSISFIERDGALMAKQHGKWGFIEQNLLEFLDPTKQVRPSSFKYKPITEFKYDSVRPFSDGLAEVYLNGKPGYINKYGHEFWSD
jgi:hypothetical protein